jgi:hypothetical protein
MPDERTKGQAEAERHREPTVALITRWMQYRGVSAPVQIVAHGNLDDRPESILMVDARLLYDMAADAMRYRELAARAQAEAAPEARPAPPAAPSPGPQQRPEQRPDGSQEQPHPRPAQADQRAATGEYRPSHRSGQR